MENPPPRLIQSGINNIAFSFFNTIFVVSNHADTLNSDGKLTHLCREGTAQNLKHKPDSLFFFCFYSFEKHFYFLRLGSRNVLKILDN